MDRTINAADLRVEYRTEKEKVVALRKASFTLREGRSIGIVGESGSGKTSLALALMGLIHRKHITSGELELFGESYLSLPEKEQKKHRWNTMAMMFQNSMNVLNPVMPIGKQLTERLVERKIMDSRQAEQEAESLLKSVGLEGWEAKAFPHQLSGGMQQRVLLAMAVACKPRFLILDEPTGSLDGLARAEMIQRIQSLQKQMNFAMLVISHDIKLIGELTQEIMVLYGGCVVEQGATDAVIEKPMHPYSRGLFNASVELAPYKDLWGIPGESNNGIEEEGCVFKNRCTQPSSLCCSHMPSLESVSIERKVACHQNGLIHVLRGEGLSKGYDIGKKSIVALDKVYMNLRHGETLAVIGPSGSGKSTLAKVLGGFTEADEGDVFFNGKKLKEHPFSCCEEGVQLVLQDPFSALSHRMTVEEAISEPLQINKIGDQAERKRRVKHALKELQLSDEEEWLHRYTSSLSGGQRQRVAIARALVMNPKVLIADEITSMLDVSTQANVLRLLKGLQSQKGFALLFITHDLNLGRKIADQLIVLDKGKVIEEGNANRILQINHQDNYQSPCEDLIKVGLING